MPEPALPRESTTMVRHVFVYGTLRRGDDNDITRLLPTPQWVGTATIVGVMYHLGAYPGVVLGLGEGLAHNTTCSVVGEVYAIEPALERVLDEIEELYPQQRDEYFKRHIPVQVHGRDDVHGGGQSLLCIVYEINPVYVTGKPVIAGGDWVTGRG